MDIEKLDKFKSFIEQLETEDDSFTESVLKGVQVIFEGDLGSAPDRIVIKDEEIEKFLTTINAKVDPWIEGHPGEDIGDDNGRLKEVWYAQYLDLSLSEKPKRYVQVPSEKEGWDWLWRHAKKCVMSSYTPFYEVTSGDFVFDGNDQSWIRDRHSTGDELVNIEELSLEEVEKITREHNPELLSGINYEPITTDDANKRMYSADRFRAIEAEEDMKFEDRAYGSMNESSDPRSPIIPHGVLSKIPALYSQDGKKDEAVAYVKLFTPRSGWTWYATEYDPESKTFFGWIEGHDKELGYFSLQEMESLNASKGYKVIEMDKYFRPTTLGKIKAGDFEENKPETLTLSQKLVVKASEKLKENGFEIKETSDNGAIVAKNGSFLKFSVENDSNNIPRYKISILDSNNNILKDSIPTFDSAINEFDELVKYPKNNSSKIEIINQDVGLILRKNGEDIFFQPGDEKNSILQIQEKVMANSDKYPMGPFKTPEDHLDSILDKYFFSGN